MDPESPRACSTSTIPEKEKGNLESTELSRYPQVREILWKSSVPKGRICQATGVGQRRVWMQRKRWSPLPPPPPPPALGDTKSSCVSGCGSGYLGNRGGEGRTLLQRRWGAKVVSDFLAVPFVQVVSGETCFSPGAHRILRNSERGRKGKEAGKNLKGH